MNRRQFLLNSGIIMTGTALPGLARAIGLSTRHDTLATGQIGVESLAGRDRIQVLGIGTGAAGIVLEQAENSVEGVSYGVVDTEVPYQLHNGYLPELRLDVWPVASLPRQTPHEEVRAHKRSMVRQQGLQNMSWIRERLREADETVFIVCLGGVTGSVLAPMFIDAAEENGYRWSVIATLPFQFEGPRKRNLAMDQIQEWRHRSDSSRVEVIDGEDVARKITSGLSLHDAFNIYNEVVADHLHRRLCAIT